MQPGRGAQSARESSSKIAKKETVDPQGIEGQGLTWYRWLVLPAEVLGTR